jgi:hypothetical protein
MPRFGSLATTWPWIYGSERAVHIEKDKKITRCLVWTDTWLKRAGKWEIVAAQDTAVPCK